VTVAATTTLARAGERVWPAVVVGAGPAGALAAHELARRGVRALLVDRSVFPRGKVCGCCLSGRALATLREAGLGNLPARCGAVPLEGARLAARGGCARVGLSGGAVLSREAFDSALVESAVRAGADFLPGTRAALEPDAGAARTVRLHQGGSVARVSARVVLAADGLGGGLLARAGLGAAPAVPGARVGAGVVAPEGPDFYAPGTVYMACGEHGYLGLVRLEDGRLDLAAALDAGRLRAAGGPGEAAAELLAEVGWPAPRRLTELAWRGTPALTRSARRVSAGRVFALGDAAGYVEPFTGEGIAWALAAGAAVAPLAARAARRWHPALAHEWAALYNRVVARRQLACRAASAVLRRPWLARALIRVLARLPALARPVVRHLHGQPI
jgi:menaquinone-9 beta-reductase